MRDIGDRAGVLGGSLYHHIKSKDALFVELHDAALDQAQARLTEAVARAPDPWAKLRAACVTLLEIQLARDSLTLPMMNDFTAVPPKVREKLIARRDRFEDLFRDLVDELPLAPNIDRSVYRNLLLSLLNSAGSWYKPGRLSPAEIGDQIALIFGKR